LQIFVQNSILELNYREQEAMSMNRERLITQIQTRLLAIVSQNKLLLVGLSEFHDAPTNQVVDLTSSIDKHEAFVTDPMT